MGVPPVKPPALGPVALGHILRVKSREAPDAVAITFEGRVTTYGELMSVCCRVANDLADRGLRMGDRIGILAKNSDDFFATLLGAALVGVVLVPVNWRLAADEIGYVTEDARLRLLLVDKEFVEIARTVVGRLDAPPTLVVLERGSDRLAPWAAGTRSDDPDIDVSTHATALQLYTSGTTGRPKGALLTHHSLNSVRVSQPAGSWSAWDATDVCLVSMPLFHIGGIGTGLASIYHAAHMVILREFSPPAVVRSIVEHGVTRLFIVPAALGMMLTCPGIEDVAGRGLRYVIYGSSPIAPTLLEEAMRIFRCPFVQVYGMTETSGTIVALPSADVAAGDDDLLRSAGKPLEGVEVVIADADGRILPAGEVGEVLLRSEAVMAGYWNMPEATASVFTPDGYLKSGDAGYLDANGYLFIHDRIKDMIITGGENVYAVEVEEALNCHPAIAEVAIIGVPDERWGEAVKAVVVATGGGQIDIDTLRAWASDRLASYKLPRSIDFVESLPRNANGKILRRQLREPHWAGHGRPI